MADQIECLYQFFVRKDVDLSDDEGDDNTSGEYWKPKDPKRLESWSVAPVLVIENVNFVMKFSTAPHALPISADERIKDVVHFKDNILHIHCKTTDADQYTFTIALNNNSSPFTVVPFLASLAGSSYEPLMKEVEAGIDRKSWVTKEGFSLQARAVASKLRSLTMSIATMVASQRAVVSALMPLDLSRVRSNTNASQGSACAQSQGGALRVTQPSIGGCNQKRRNNVIDSTPADSQVRHPTSKA